MILPGVSAGSECIQFRGITGIWLNRIKHILSGFQVLR